MTYFCSQFNAMELSQTSRTIQEIQQEIQNYVFDFNVHQQSLNLDPAADETAVCEGNNMPTFPGLKGRTLSSLVTPSSVPEESAAKDRDRINEIVMLQQVLSLVTKKLPTTRPSDIFWESRCQCALNFLYKM